MHWVARWGEIENIKYLHQSGMAIYIPDNYGYIPLDYAGLFHHKEAMIYLIKKGVEEAKWQLMMSFSKSGLTSTYGDPNSIFSGPELQINPVYRSKLLYWSTYLSDSEFSWKDYNALMYDIEPFPEYKNRIDKNKSALHVAAITGHEKKLRILLNNLTKKYDFGINTPNQEISLD
jgi:ankyrin repeat protein